MNDKPKPEPRERSVAHLWADKRIMRLFRKNLPKIDYRKFRSVYLALCEIDSDFSEHKHNNKKRQLHGIVKTCATYAGMSGNLINPIMIQLRDIGLIDYGRQKNDKNEVIGSFLIMYEYPLNIDTCRLNLENCNKGNLGSIRNKSSLGKSLLRNKDLTALGKSEKVSLGNGNKKKALYHLIEYWNGLKNTRKHIKPDKQVYKDAVHRLNLLATGRLDKFKFDDTWLKRCDIPPRYLIRKWSDKRVKEVMDMLNCLFTEGYWPENKKFLPRGLSELIYNPRKQSSMFLYVASNGVKELHEIADKRKEKKIRDIKDLVDLLRTALNDSRGLRKLHPGEYDVLANIVIDMNKIKRDDEHYPSLESLVKDYADWIYDRFEGDEKLMVSWFQVDSYKWEDYVAWVKDDIGINLTT